MNEQGIAFSRFHPVTLFFYFLCLMIFTMFTQNPVLLVSSFIGSALFSLVTNTGKQTLADIKFYIPTFLLISVTNPLFSHNGVTPLFFMNDNPVTLEAVLCGINIALMLTSVMIACKNFSKVMESDKLLALFGKISPRLSVTVSMSLRFIPLFKRKWEEIRDTQKAMGYLRGDSAVDKLFSYARIFSALVTWALENGVDTADSMSARGYELPNKKGFSLFRFRKSDLAMLTATAILSALVTVGAVLGKTDFGFYPHISPLGTDAISLCSYTSFAILALLPFIFEVKEAIRWKYLISGI